MKRKLHRYKYLISYFYAKGSQTGYGHEGLAFNNKPYADDDVNEIVTYLEEKHEYQYVVILNLIPLFKEP